MKTFVLSLAFFVVALVLAGLLYRGLEAPSTQVFTMEHVRVDHSAPADGRLDWAAGSEAEEDV